MARKGRQAAATTPERHVASGMPERCEATGAGSRRLAAAIMRSSVAAAPVSSAATDEERTDRLGAALDLAREHRPHDGVSGAMASLATSLFFSAEALLARARRSPDLPAPVAARVAVAGARLAEAFVAVSEAIERRRGGGAHRVHQTVRIERVEVAAGAQAVVGAVAPSAVGGGDGGG